MPQQGQDDTRPTAIDVACEFLRLAQQEPDEPELLTPMRLQKLVYYAQGWALAFHERALFTGRIEAWKHGPVAPDLYPLTKGCENSPIPSDRASIGRTLPREASDLVMWVWRKYRGCSASKLRAMTHQESPWVETRAGLAEGEPSDAMISEQTMRRFFETEHDRTAPEGLDIASYRRAEEDVKAGRLVSMEEIEREFRRAPRPPIHA